jgi:hypothetical protein
MRVSQRKSAMQSAKTKILLWFQGQLTAIKMAEW